MAKRSMKTLPASPRWVEDITPPEKNAWAVPVNWLLAQALKHLMADEEKMVFVCKDGKLFIHGFLPDDEIIETPRGAAKRSVRATAPKKAWADEFPPWP
jgi:hypothetical protein